MKHTKGTANQRGSRGLLHYLPSSSTQTEAATTQWSLAAAAAATSTPPHTRHHHHRTGYGFDHVPQHTRAVLQRKKKTFATPTEKSVHGDALCFMVTGPSLLQRLAVGSVWRLVGVGGWWRLAVGGRWGLSSEKLLWLLKDSPAAPPNQQQAAPQVTQNRPGHAKPPSEIEQPRTPPNQQQAAPQVTQNRPGHAKPPSEIERPASSLLPDGKGSPAYRSTNHFPQYPTPRCRYTTGWLRWWAAYWQMMQYPCPQTLSNVLASSHARAPRPGAPRPWDDVADLPLSPPAPESSSNFSRLLLSPAEETMAMQCPLGPTLSGRPPALTRRHKPNLAPLA